MGDPEGKRPAIECWVTGRLADMSVHSENDEVQVSEELASKKKVFEELFARTTSRLREAGLGRHGNWTDSRQRPTICLVPDELKRRNVVQQAHEHQGYRPVAVRIAPEWFCSYEDLGSAVDKMEVYKRRCAWPLLNNQQIVSIIMHIMPAIKACYGISDSDSHSIVKMANDILLGGCFIVHRLLKHAERNENRRTNQFDEDQLEWVWQFVTRDLLLLQNQIPFLVVRELFQFQQLGNDKPEDALVTGSLGLFRSFCPELLHSYPRSGPQIAQVHHLLHLFYFSVVHGRATSTTDSSHQDNLLLPELPQWIPSAKVLEDSGVRFRRMKDAKSFLDIKFDVRHGILEIPPLQLCDYSDALFRNLIAFEQTCPGIGHVISAYAIFMDCLIKAPEDMRILNQRGIVTSRISGDQNDSCFFSRISAHVPMPADNYLAALMNDVSTNKDYRRRKWYTQLVRNYCSTPWVAMSVFAAVLLLCLTVLQTFFTIYPYYNPRD